MFADVRRCSKHLEKQISERLQNEYRRRADSLEDSLADKRKSKQKSNLNEQSIGDRLDHERFLARSAVPSPRNGNCAEQSTGLRSKPDARSAHVR